MADVSVVKGVIVAGTHSGCGKTSVCTALIAALTAKGFVVQGGKIGPDAVDACLHSLVSGRPDITLDSWMYGLEAMPSIVGRALTATGTSTTASTDAGSTTTAHADILIVEGVMGLYDGACPTTEKATTAEISKALGLPILLVVDARSLSRSIAALVHGYTTFDPELQFAGVLCNNVGSPKHAALLTEALEHYCPDIPVLGCLLRDASISLPTQRSGLAMPKDSQWKEQLIQWMHAACDIDALVQSLPDCSFPCSPLQPTKDTSRKGTIRIGIAKDAAFSYMYEENCALLRQAGAELVFFSPLSDIGLPTALDALWLPGGQPDIYGAQLSRNVSIRHGIREFAAQGGLIYAEGGGFFYLMDSITDEEGRIHLTAGCLPLHALLRKKRQALGYRQATTVTQSFFGLPGTVLRGHEFHHNHCIGLEQHSPAFSVQDSTGKPLAPYGLHAGCSSQAGRIMGSSLHLHLASNPRAAQAFVAACTDGVA